MTAPYRQPTPISHQLYMHWRLYARDGHPKRHAAAARERLAGVESPTGDIDFADHRRRERRSIAAALRPSLEGVSACAPLLSSEDSSVVVCRGSAWRQDWT